jgi:hypothetical protein
MSGQGYHLAIDQLQLDEILSYDDEGDILDRTSEILEAMWANEDTTHVEGGYKDWNVLLCCLTNGSYDPTGGSYPLNKCFFGGRLLVREGSIVNLVMPDEVRDVFEALDKIDQPELTARHMRLPQDQFHLEDSARDEEYTNDLWMKLNKLNEFYCMAAKEGRAVMFYTDDPLDYFFKPPPLPSGV